MSDGPAKRRRYDEQLRGRGARLAWRVEEPVPFCWLCDRVSGKRAREHVFPQWLLQALGAEDEEFHPVHRDMLGRLVSARGPIPARAFVAGEVCEACNHGWMSDLEVLVAPILFPPGGRGTLSVRDQAVLSRWLIKTAVVLNTSQNYRLMVPREARHALAHGVPSDFGVYLARHAQTDGGQLNFMQVAGVSMSIVQSDRVDEHAHASERVYGCALAINDFLGVVIYAVPGAWAVPSEPMARIWPPTQAVRWGDLPTFPELAANFSLAGQHPEFGIEGLPSEVWMRATAE